MAQGNLAFDRENFTEATGYFMRVVSNFPEYAAGWNNLGYTLEARGCSSAGHAAKTCARRLAPEAFSSDSESLKTDSTMAKDCPALPTCPVR